MTEQPDAQVAHGEPWWVVVTKLTEEEYASTTVDAPTENDARAAGERIIASQEETEDFEVRTVRGPFPRSPGTQNVAVRPSMCAGCGLHRWPADSSPGPQCTWFERESTGGDAVTWSCIACGTLTHLNREDMVI